MPQDILKDWKSLALAAAISFAVGGGSGTFLSQGVSAQQAKEIAQEAVNTGPYAQDKGVIQERLKNVEEDIAEVKQDTKRIDRNVQKVLVKQGVEPEKEE